MSDYGNYGIITEDGVEYRAEKCYHCGGIYKGNRIVRVAAGYKSECDEIGRKIDRIDGKVFIAVVLVTMGFVALLVGALSMVTAIAGGSWRPIFSIIMVSGGAEVCVLSFVYARHEMLSERKLLKQRRLILTEHGLPEDETRYEIVYE